MKKIIMMTAILLFVGVQTVMAVHGLVNEIKTPFYNDHQKAVEVGKQTAEEILQGRNEIANGESAIECPQMNNPNFKIIKIRTGSHLVPEGGKFVEKYESHIYYEVLCSRLEEKENVVKQLEIETLLYETKSEALNEAKEIASQVKQGKNKIALAEGVFECAQVNYPKFKVLGIKVVSYFPSDQDYDERYMASVRYNLECPAR